MNAPDHVALRDVDFARIINLPSPGVAARSVTVIDGRPGQFDLPPEPVHDPLTEAANSLRVGAHAHSDRLRLVTGLLRELKLSGAEVAALATTIFFSYDDSDWQVKTALEKAVEELHRVVGV